jgi:hypothetical protein
MRQEISSIRDGDHDNAHTSSSPYGISNWNFQLSITALIFYSSLIGGAIVAVLALPKLAKKSLHGRSMNREIQKLKEKILELGKRHVGGSQIE